MQAPNILMSQNRQAYKDRLSAEHDYEVNLKAENKKNRWPNKESVLKGNIIYFTPYARQLVGKTIPQIALEAFVYFGSYIEENNIVNEFTLGARGQISDDLDFAAINGDF